MALLEKLFRRPTSRSAPRVVSRHGGVLAATRLMFFVSIVASTVSGEFKFYKSHPNGDIRRLAFGSKLVINCTTNDPTAITNLYRQDFLKTEFKLLSYTNKKIEREGDVFTITDFGTQSAGTYQCKSINNKNKTIKWKDPSEFVSAEEIIPPKPKISPSRKSLDIGENFNLSCTTHDVNVNFTWSKIIQNKSHSPISADRIRSFVNGKKTSFMTIRNATIQDSGQYVCVAIDGDLTGQDNAIIQVYEPPNERKFASIAPYPGTVRAPSDVVINCAFSGYPPPTIRWYRHNQEILGCIESARQDCTKSKYVMRTIAVGERFVKGVLMIFRTDYSDHGSYECAAFNKKGNTSVSVFVNIETPAKVQVNAKDQVITAELGKTLNITCQAVGQPVPIVSWIRNRNRQVLKQGKGQAVLILKSISVEDLGNYTCNATNFKSDYKLFTVKERQREGTRLKPQIGFTTEKLIIVITVCASVIIIIIVAICIIMYCRQKRANKYNYDLSLEKMADYEFDPDHTLLEQCRNLPYDPDWEFPEERLIIGETLGSGAFGLVLQAEAIGIQALRPRDKSPEAARLRAKLHHSSVLKRKSKKQRCNSVTSTKQTVALKTLKDGANKNDYTDLASELKILIYIGEHDNIINILGACTRGKRLMVIMEYAPYGDLLSFLREKRDIYEPNWSKMSNNPEQEFTLVDLAMTAYQISRGMEFLASRKCIHRDLAARNILVGYNYVMKISDFGLARDIYQDDMYVKTSRGLLPIKWMALESLFDRVYTHMSDVWSFGIVLWETFTLGGTPYPSVPIEQLMDFLEQGQRLPQPSFCPDDIYNIMLSCWSHYPQDRPTFEEISRQLEQIFRENVTENSLGYLHLNGDTVQYRNDYRSQEDEPLGCSSNCEQANQNAAKSIPEAQSSTKAAASSSSTSNHNNNNLYSNSVSKRPYHNEHNPLLNHESAV